MGAVLASVAGRQYLAGWVVGGVTVGLVSVDLLAAGAGNGSVSVEFGETDGTPPRLLGPYIVIRGAWLFSVPA